MIEDNTNDNINHLISKIDWSKTSERDRKAIAESFSALELSSQINIITKSIAKARLLTFSACLIIVCILMIFSVDPGIILGVSLSIQMLFLAVSQIFEFGTTKLSKKSEESTIALLKKLTIRYPLTDMSDDIYIV